MTRYWININDIKPEDDEIVLEEEREAIEDVNHILKYRFGFDRNLDGFVYKTNDKLEMQEVVTKVKKALASYLFEYFTDHESFLSVFTQPQCPICEKLSWFDEKYCSKCGEKLTPKEMIDITEIGS